MNRIKLIVSDLDGTLLSERNELEQEVLDTIERFRASGGQFTIATGRPLITALPILQTLNIELPVILCNGAVIAKDGHVVEQHCFLLAKLSHLLIEAHDEGLTVLLFCHSNIFIFEHTADAKVYEQKEKISCTVIPLEGMEWAEKQADKVILIGDIERSLFLWKKYQSALDDYFGAFQSEYNYLEIVDKSCSKGSAVTTVAELLGVSREHIMTIGNEMNDLPMYAASAVGVAVANGREGLKEAADYICQKAYGQGVVEAIERFALETALQRGDE